MLHYRVARRAEASLDRSRRRDAGEGVGRSARAPDPQRVRERRHAGVGLREPQHRRARAVPRRQRPRPRAVHARGRAARTSSRGSKAAIRRRRRCCSWVTPTSCRSTPTAGERDPFAGEIVDDEVWGRGAVDMLNLTATMAVAFRDLARSGFKPKGTLVYLAVADEENLGTWGAEHLRRARARRGDGRLRRHRGRRLPDADATGPRLPVIVGEKGSYWCRITVRGTPGHASQPFRTDNALVTAAEVVRRLAEYRPPTHIHDTWRRFIEGVDFGPEWNASAARRGARCTEFCEKLPIGLAPPGARVHAHDVRADDHPRRHQDQRDPRPRRARGRHPHAARPEGAPTSASCSTRRSAISPTTSRSRRSTRTSRPRHPPTRRCGTRWAACRRGWSRARRSCRSSPSARTDARFFRREGSVAYGFGLFSRRLSFDDYASMFHGNDERVDTESLVLSTRLWDGLARDLLN